MKEKTTVKIRSHILFIVLVSIGCAPKRAGEAPAQGSVPTDTLRQGTKSPSIIEFTNNDVFTDIIPVDMTDPDDIQKWFPGDDGACEGIDNDDETPWYRLCSYNNGSLAITYWDFYNSDPARLYFYQINITDPNIVVSKGIHVGMSKSEFITILGVTDPGAPNADGMWVRESTTRHRVFFQFENDRLKFISHEFDYEGNIPRTIEDFIGLWSEATITEVDSGVDSTIPCDPFQYQIEQISVTENEKEVKKYLMTVGRPHETRVDSVQSIRRTSDGFVINVLNSSDSQKPYVVTVVFLYDQWGIANWNDVAMVSEHHTAPVNSGPCDEEEPE